MAKNTKVITTSGNRKRAVARATLSPGTGLVRINSKVLDVYEPELARLKITEPLILAGDVSKSVNIAVKVQGGGIMSQVEAIRTAISRALAIQGGEKVRKALIDYNRNFIVVDTRRKEACKPNDSKARAKRQKSYR